MKQIHLICITISLAIGLIAWKYSSPFMAKGTAVIYSMTNMDRHGNQPYTTLISKDLSPKQLEKLNFAYAVAKSDGFKNPTLLQGILMQETLACTLKNFRVAGLTNKPGDRYFGCGQIKLAAAKQVLNTFPELRKYLETKTDEELQARLILDDEFNIRVSSKYTLLMGINNDPSRAVTAYNQGLGGAKNIDPSKWEYTNQVKKFSKSMKNIQVSKSDIKSHSKHKLVVASVE